MAAQKSFMEYLSENTGLSTADAARLSAGVQARNVTKGEFVLREGDPCHHAFFVEKGLLRIYTIGENGKEHIIQFAPENWWFADRSSLYFNQPSEYFVEAVEDSRIAFVEKDFFAASENAADIRINRFNDRLLNNHIRHLQRRINQLLSTSAEKRYLEFLDLYPDLPMRVPQWMIASYLGITPEGLSRVRKELARQHRRNE